MMRRTEDGAKCKTNTHHVSREDPLNEIEKEWLEGQVGGNEEAAMLQKLSKCFKMEKKNYQTPRRMQEGKISVRMFAW